MGLFQRSEMCQPTGYVPLWKDPAAQAVSPPEPVVDDETKDHSLNRLQRSLIWFAAVLIAVSMFENIRNNF